MKQVAGTLRLDLAAFRSLEAFAQFGSDLDKATQSQLNRGVRLIELLKQGRFVPVPVENQVIALFAGGKGYLDDLAVDKVQAFRDGLIEYVHGSYGDVLTSDRRRAQDLGRDRGQAQEGHRGVQGHLLGRARRRG